MTVERRKGGAELDGALVGPGEIALVEDGSRMVAILASGVAVCLWAPQEKVAAMAHFVEPRTTDKHSCFARFGNVAVPEVVRLVRAEVPQGKLEAQLFGGAQEYPGDPRGPDNVAMAEKVLAARQIEISSRDVGGTKGRKVLFDGKSGQVAILKVHKLREEDWK
ncbi:MAG: chemotaxis protein CheD [Fibrobacteres bacterium]|nr:chemotaxis protein CheD [Fibrobacterota bacterium]